MSVYLGDFDIGDTIDFTFTTRKFSTGAPFTLAGSPAVVAYVGLLTSEITDGISITADFDNKTGLNNVHVVIDGSDYDDGDNVSLVLSAGTVDGVSVANETLAHFSVRDRVVKMGNFAHGGDSASLRLSGRSGGIGLHITGEDAFSAPLYIDAGSTNQNAVTMIGGNDASALSLQSEGLGAGLSIFSADTGPAILLAAGATSGNAISITTTDGHGISFDISGSSKVAINAADGGIVSNDLTLSAAGIRAAMGLSAADLDTQLDAIAAFVDTEIAAIQSTLSTLFTTTITEPTYRTDGASGSLAQLMYEINQTLGERSFSGVTGTVKKVDGTTTAFTQTLDSASTPTSIARS